MSGSLCQDHTKPLPYYGPHWPTLAVQWRRMWATVCRLAPQSQRGLMTGGTFVAKMKSLNPTFPVCSCTSSALSRLGRPSWSRSTFLVGIGVCLWVAQLFRSLRHFAVHACYACVLHHLFTVRCIVNSWGGASAGKLLRPCSLDLVASLAAPCSHLSCSVSRGREHLKVHARRWRRRGKRNDTWSVAGPTIYC